MDGRRLEETFFKGLMILSSLVIFSSLVLILARRWAATLFGSLYTCRVNRNPWLSNLRASASDLASA